MDLQVEVLGGSKVELRGVRAGQRGSPVFLRGLGVLGFRVFRVFRGLGLGV